MSGDGDRWSLLVPVKRLSLAKTRLAVASDVRREVALAMAIDTVSAATAAASVAAVVVITDDPRAAQALAAIGARVVADAPDAGLNPALVHGAEMAAEMTEGSRVAALSSDLPALRAADLDLALGQAALQPSAVVADVAGTGTTMLAAAAKSGFHPAFGAESFAAHLRAGATDISDVVATTVRHDVDTIDALRAAVGLGVGRETARVLAELAVLGD
jgi:2-phospho-L-lactate guanylyltransferase